MAYTMQRRALLAAASAALMPYPALAVVPGGRTYYDRLALDTPATAAATFAAAYADRDFYTVWLILARDAQEAVQHAIVTFDVAPFLALTAKQSLEFISQAMPPLDQWEQYGDIGWLFDHVMDLGAKQGMLPFELSAGTAAVPAGDDPPRFTLAARSGPVRLTLVPSPSRRWRVLSAVTEGRDGAKLPWGLG